MTISVRRPNQGFLKLWVKSLQTRCRRPQCSRR
jgi:hypothetical protein